MARELLKRLLRFCRNEESPTFLEYGLLITLIAIVAAVAVTAIGNSVAGLFTSGANAF